MGMSNFKKLKSMSLKELYNFLTINKIPTTNGFLEDFYTVLRNEETWEIAKFLWANLENNCLLCARCNTTCNPMCDAGREEFLRNDWKGYKAI